MQDKELHQEVQGDVQGDMAGRDVVKHLKVDRVDVQKVDVHIYPPEPPKTLPSKTALEKAKELMPPVCHEELDWLALHSDVHGKCLLLACKNKALICRDGRLGRAKSLPDYSMGGLSISILLAFGAYATLLWIAFNVNLSQTSQLILFGLMAASSLGIWWLQRQFFYPHVVARTATEALARRDAT